MNKKIEKQIKDFPAATTTPRKAHPNLYYAVTAGALGCVALGLNFIFLKPAFNPLDIPKEIFGILFLALGLAKLYFVNFYRVKVLRSLMALEVSLMFFYSLLLIFQFFQLNQTSLQLPITYLIIVALEYPLLVEPFINPVTSTGDENDVAR